MKKLWTQDFESSNVLQATYYDNNTLEIIFIDREGNTSKYHYYNVQAYIADGLRNAPSAGKYVHGSIRNKYDYRLVEENVEVIKVDKKDETKEHKLTPAERHSKEKEDLLNLYRRMTGEIEEEPKIELTKKKPEPKIGKTEAVEEKLERLERENRILQAKVNTMEVQLSAMPKFDYTMVSNLINLHDRIELLNRLVRNNTMLNNYSQCNDDTVYVTNKENLSMSRRIIHEDLQLSADVITLDNVSRARGKRLIVHPDVIKELCTEMLDFMEIHDMIKPKGKVIAEVNMEKE